MKNTNMKKYTIIIVLILSASIAYAQKKDKTKFDSLDIKIGQMIMVGYGGTSLKSDDPIVEEIRNGSVGGVILFEKNISDTNSVIRLKQLTYALQSLA
ncbi:MAG: glycoside hydrolase family 3 protein, partial [Bacteroidetes bacterium]